MTTTHTITSPALAGGSPARPHPTPSPLTRAVAALVGAGLVLTALAGCQSTTYKCQNNECTFTLQGENADFDTHEKGSSSKDGVKVVLQKAEDGLARFTVNGAAGQCKAGQTVPVAGYTVTCTEVGDNKLKGSIKGS